MKRHVLIGSVLGLALTLGGLPAHAVVLRYQPKVGTTTQSTFSMIGTMEMVAGQTGVKIAVLATNVGAFDGVTTYYDMFDYNVKTLLGALSGSPSK